MTLIFDQLVVEYAYPPIYAALCEALGEPVPAFRPVSGLRPWSAPDGRGGWSFPGWLAEQRIGLVLADVKAPLLITSAAIA